MLSGCIHYVFNVRLKDLKALRDLKAFREIREPKVPRDFKVFREPKALRVFKDPKGLKEVAAMVAARIKQECPKVVWKQSYVTMGRFDVVDIVESDDPMPYLP